MDNPDDNDDDNDQLRYLQDALRTLAVKKTESNQNQIVHFTRQLNICDSTQYDERILNKIAKYINETYTG